MASVRWCTCIRNLSKYSSIPLDPWLNVICFRVVPVEVLTLYDQGLTTGKISISSMYGRSAADAEHTDDI